MKHNVIFILLLCFKTTHTDLRNFIIKIEPQWCNLADNHKKNNQFDDTQWIWAGSITFKNKSKRNNPAIEKICFKWQGKQITHLFGSLYKKEPYKKFLAIEENLLCEAKWSVTKQTLVFKFNEKMQLGHLSIFYLVLTIPNELEPELKKGSFKIEEEWLPEPFKLAKQETLSFAHLQ